MKNILLLNKIAKVGTDRLPADLYRCAADAEAPEGILVRSAKMHDMQFNPELLAIARAGAGVNNIPLDRCADEGIVVFNTPGANANGVKELAVLALLLASRKVVDGIVWARSLAGTPDVAKQVEAGKSAFAGCEIKGKTLGVIGLGAIGAMVANTALSLGMSVVGCDPFLSVDGAWRLDTRVRHAATFEEVFAVSDYVTLHVPATPETTGMISAASLATMKDGVKILNLARAELVNAADMAAALESGKVSAYVTDFPTEATVAMPGAITIPHLGASTEESEDNCAVMAADELDEYLRLGNIRNSVNYPALQLAPGGKNRICVLHDSAESAADALAAAKAAGVEISAFASKSKGSAAYTVMDTDSTVGDAVLSALRALPGVRRVRNIAF